MTPTDPPSPAPSAPPVDVDGPTWTPDRHPAAAAPPPVTGAPFVDPSPVGASDPPRGERLDARGRYRVRELLGEGGMGRVSLVDDRHIGRKVAAKELHADAAARDESVQRFLREARIQGQLEHPSIVPVYDIGQDADGNPYFTMRRVQGTTLRDVLEGGAEAAAARGWSRRKLLTAFVSVCLAVHYAHTRGVVHRDLKPTNIMLGEYGEVYVLDWGIARVRGQSDLTLEDLLARSSFGALGTGPQATAVGAVLGTPAYMSPEQLRADHAALDGRSDVYALGMILYELCAARPFHAGKSLGAIASETLLGVRAVPSEAAPDTPPELDALVQRCTALAPADRFATAGELARAVESYLDGDRDLERRRDLAAAAAREARAAAERAFEATGTEEEALRKDALRAVVRSLALDPEQRDARSTFVRLLVEAPKDPPAAVRDDMAAWAAETRREGLRFGIWGLLAWCAAIPAALALGVRNAPAAVAAATTVVVFTLAMGWMFRAREERAARVRAPRRPRPDVPRAGGAGPAQGGGGPHDGGGDHEPVGVAGALRAGARGGDGGPHDDGVVLRGARAQGAARARRGDHRGALRGGGGGAGAAVVRHRGGAPRALRAGVRAPPAAHALGARLHERGVHHRAAAPGGQDARPVARAPAALRDAGVAPAADRRG